MLIWITWWDGEVLEWPVVILEWPVGASTLVILGWPVVILEWPVRGDAWWGVHIQKYIHTWGYSVLIRITWWDGEV